MARFCLFSKEIYEASGDHFDEAEVCGWEPFYAGSQVFHLGNGMGNMRLLDVIYLVHVKRKKAGIHLIDP